MDLKKIKEMLRDKKARRKIAPKLIASILAVICVITLAGGIVLNNKLRKEEDSKNITTSTNKENKEVVINNEEKAKKELEELKNKDTSNLSNEEKKELEDKIAEAEEKVNKAIEVASNSSSEKSNSDSVSESTENNSSQTSQGGNSSSSSSEVSKLGEKSSEPVKQSEPVKKHTHTWVDITEEIVHPEEGHWEEVVVTPEQVKEVPIYERFARDICNGCGLDITENPVAHIKEQALKGNYACGGHHTEYREVQTGTKKEVIQAVTEKKWIVDKPAWTETKVVGRKCKECGANE
ncbi:hypothetical protein [uncultured Clostridium sp.]|uniref:hypothetical protein n=1 Tax=uncultured Clostridium sp. TaxID=59620 RepID=UPI0025DD861D|nr:hypothetical protein [uncultured Clostridium sp.]